MPGIMFGLQRLPKSLGLSCCSTCNAFTNRQLRRLYISMQFQDNLDRIDLFEYDGQTSLLVTNLYSKYFEIELLCQNTASCTRNKRERCQRQRTTEEQHQIIVLQKPWIQEIPWRVRILQYNQLTRVSSIKWSNRKSGTDGKMQS